ncbi:MAG: AMP-binding protein, partial [Pseudomonadota bacterium]
FRARASAPVSAHGSRPVISGLAEASDHEVIGNKRMRSAGRPYPGVKIKIIDEDHQPLPINEVGQICIKSAGNMKGYWQRPEATAETLIDGYILTGDAGYLDEDGYVYVHDRVKEMIVSGAENIYPAEVENAIFDLEGVADVAVIGVPDEKWGEAVKAMVQLKPDAKLSANDIIGHARTKIAGYKVPKSVDFIDEVPRNPSGKLLRRQLREPFWANHERLVN